MNQSLQSDRIIREAIRNIAREGIVNPHTGAVRGSAKVSGFVAKIHEDGEFAGTVDVQEYISYNDRKGEGAVGYHEGVLLSALQDNSSGYLVMPKLYSDVVICSDVASGCEYVILVSHVDVVRIDSHTEVSIGVREREQYSLDDEEGPDMDELKETGVMAVSRYAKDSISSEVTDSKKRTAISQLPASYSVDVAGKSSLVMEDDAVVKAGSSLVKVESGTVYVGSDSGTDCAVLGTELCNLLSEILTKLSTTLVPIGSPGSTSPLTTCPDFASLASKVASMASSMSGILTKKVQLQK